MTTRAEKIAALSRVVARAEVEAIHNGYPQDAEVAALRALLADLEAGEQGWRPIAELVDRFLMWPLPQSVCSDGCVTDPNYRFPRAGTNLLTAEEARQMIEYLLAQPPAESREEVVSHTTGGQSDQPGPRLHNTAAPSPVGGAAALDAANGESGDG